jgi:hypothetical protein
VVLGGAVATGGGELCDCSPDPEIPNWAALAGGARGGADCEEAVLDRRSEAEVDEPWPDVPVD